MLISLRARLEPAALESEFRLNALAADKRVVGGLAIVGIVFLIATVPVTFVLAGSPERLHRVWAIRAIDLAVTIVALVVVRRVDNPKSYDAIVTAWIGIWFVGVVAENALLPPAFTSFVSWDAFLAVAVYAAVALPFPRQAALAAMLSLGDVRTLQGIIPICSHCKNVRTDAGEWQEIEAYVRAHSDAHFSHGVCPACMRLHYPQVSAGKGAL